MTTISIPFPAWDGAAQIAAVCEKIRERLGHAPNLLSNPRRIVLKDSDEEGLWHRLSLWSPFGNYAMATLRGHEDFSYGTSWQLVNLRLRWRGDDYNYELQLDGWALAHLDDCKLAPKMTLR